MSAINKKNIKEEGSSSFLFSSKKWKIEPNNCLNHTIRFFAFFSIALLLTLSARNANASTSVDFFNNWGQHREFHFDGNKDAILNEICKAKHLGKQQTAWSGARQKWNNAVETTKDSLPTNIEIKEIKIGHYTHKHFYCDTPGDGYCIDDTVVEDCAGFCGGDAVEDCAGVCGGDAVADCAGDCGGSAVADCNEDCGGSAVADCNGDCGGSAVKDCNGDCGGSAVEDCAGDCGGSAVEDCAGDCGGSAVADCNGDCGGSAVADCHGDCGGSAVADCHGVCGGTDKNCEGEEKCDKDSEALGQEHGYYQGCQNVTLSGKTCLNWSDGPAATEEEDGNYCRNPDGSDTIWCYTACSDQQGVSCQEFKREYCIPIGYCPLKEYEYNDRIKFLFRDLLGLEEELTNVKINLDDTEESLNREQASWTERTRDFNKFKDEIRAYSTAMEELRVELVDKQRDIDIELDDLHKEISDTVKDIDTSEQALKETAKDLKNNQVKEAELNIAKEGLEFKLKEFSDYSTAGDGTYKGMHNHFRWMIEQFDRTYVQCKLKGFEFNWFENFRDLTHGENILMCELTQEPGPFNTNKYPNYKIEVRPQAESFQRSLTDLYEKSKEWNQDFNFDLNAIKTKVEEDVDKVKNEQSIVAQEITDLKEKYDIKRIEKEGQELHLVSTIELAKAQARLRDANIENQVRLKGTKDNQDSNFKTASQLYGLETITLENFFAETLAYREEIKAEITTLEEYYHTTEASIDNLRAICERRECPSQFPQCDDDEGFCVLEKCNLDNSWKGCVTDTEQAPWDLGTNYVKLYTAMDESAIGGVWSDPKVVGCNSDYVDTTFTHAPPCACKKTWVDPKDGTSHEGCHKEKYFCQIDGDSNTCIENVYEEDNLFFKDCTNSCNEDLGSLLDRIDQRELSLHQQCDFYLLHCQNEPNTNQKCIDRLEQDPDFIDYCIQALTHTDFITYLIDHFQKLFPARSTDVVMQQCLEPMKNNCENGYPYKLGIPEWCPLDYDICNHYETSAESCISGTWCEVVTSTDSSCIQMPSKDCECRATWVDPWYGPEEGCGQSGYCQIIGNSSDCGVEVSGNIIKQEDLAGLDFPLNEDFHWKECEPPPPAADACECKDSWYDTVDEIQVQGCYVYWGLCEINGNASDCGESSWTDEGIHYTVCGDGDPG